MEGENLIVERREFSSDRGQLPEMMAGLIALDVDVIFVVGVWAALAAKNATDRIPIVFSAGDPVGRGLVSNLARPERNLTGTSTQFVELQAKRVDLLKIVTPGMKRVAALMNTDLGYPPTMFNDSNKPRGVEVLSSISETLMISVRLSPGHRRNESMRCWSRRGCPRSIGHPL